VQQSSPERWGEPYSNWTGAVDQRDSRTWIAVELTPLGEAKVEDGSLAGSLRADLGVDESFPVFIPAVTFSKGNRKVTIHLLEGYVFVPSGLTETTYFGLERKPYIGRVMSSQTGPHKIRTPSVIPDSRVAEMRGQLRKMVASDIEVGEQVRVTEGTYRSLEGQVVGMDPGGEAAFIHVRLRSLERITLIPLVMLETIRQPTGQEKA